MRSNPSKIDGIKWRGHFGAPAPVLLLVGLLWLAVSVCPAQRYFYDNNQEAYGALASDAVNTRLQTMSPNDVAQARLRIGRKVRAERDSEKQEQERQQREEDAERRRANAYQPPPTVNQSVTLFGYEPMDPEERIQSTLAANQAAARAAEAASMAPAEPVEAVKQVPGMLMVVVGDNPFYYKNGEFFVLNKKDELVHVEGPDGAVVFDIPDSAKTLHVDDKTIFEYNGTYYGRSLLMGQVVYEVVAPPDSK